MTSVIGCVRCRQPFRINQGEEWKTLCYPCWKDQRNKRAGITTNADAATVAEVLKRIPWLLQLCHPDKHNGSALATKATQWLLELKRRA